MGRDVQREASLELQVLEAVGPDPRHGTEPPGAVVLAAEQDVGVERGEEGPPGGLVLEAPEGEARDQRGVPLGAALLGESRACGEQRQGRHDHRFT